MKKQIITVLLLCLFSLILHAKPEATISPQAANMGDTLTLTITDDNLQGNAMPDLMDLNENFTVIGIQRSINYSIVNGKTINVSQWIVLLRPKRPGTITIPSIAVNNQYTNALSVTVSASADIRKNIDKSGQNKDIMLTLNVDNKMPYINQQILCTIRLYNRKRLLDSHYQPPEMENALLIPLGDTRQYQTVEDNKTYMVEEQRYAIFPQKSGELIIPSPVFTALIYDLVPSEVTIKAKPLKIMVKPNPHGDVQSFLPAKNIQLTETWDSAERNLKQGNTITRNIEIEATGIPAQFLRFLREPSANTDSYRVYPEKGQETNIIRDGNIVGKIHMKITYLFDKPGDITIPEFRVPWFNPETEIKMQAALPPATFTIKSDKAVAKKIIPEPTKSAIENKPVTSKTAFPVSLIFAVMFVFFLVLILFFWIISKQKSLSNRKVYRKSMRNLRLACLSNNPDKTRTALLDWAASYWPNDRILNLSDIVERVHHDDLKKALLALSAVLYDGESHGNWKGKDLWEGISREVEAGKKRHNDKTMLPPLIPRS